MQVQLHQNLKPEIELQIATYRIGGKNLTEHAADEVVNRIEQHQHILRGMHIQGLLFSFKGVEKIDKNALMTLVKAFNIFHAKLRTFAGFCDYSSTQFNVLQLFIKNTPLALFRNREVMALAIGTSPLHNFSSILVHTDDVDDRQAIASTLISNNYFVIMAMSKQDFQAKMMDKNRFDRVVSLSYFGNMHEDVGVKFEHDIFIYEFKGALNEDISKRISVKDFQYRLELGYRVFIFDLTRIFHMDLRAAYMLLELDKLAQPAGAQICVVDINKEKIDTNAISILGKSNLWVFDSLEEVYEDEEIMLMTGRRRVHYTTGISKDLLSFVPHLIAASMQSLDIYEIRNPEKSPSKQTKLSQLVRLKPTIATHITFDGDYEGELFFLFAQKSTETLITHILGDFDSFEGEDFLDAMTEFVNSVTGKLKSNLRKKHKCVQFSLPHSTAALEDVIDGHPEQAVVLTSFKCEGHPYYVALTSPIERMESL